MLPLIKSGLFAFFLCFAFNLNAQNFLNQQEGESTESVPLPKRWGENVKNKTLSNKQRRLILRIALRKYLVKELAAYGNSGEKKFQSWLKKLINSKLEEFVFHYKMNFPSHYLAKVHQKVYIYKFMNYFRPSPYFARFRMMTSKNTSNKNIINLFSQNGQPAAIVLLPQRATQIATCPGIKEEETPQLPEEYKQRAKFNISPGSPMVQAAFDFLMPLGQKMGKLKISPQLCQIATEFLLERQNFEEYQNITLPWSYQDILTNESVKNGVIIFAKVTHYRMGSILPRIHILRIRDGRLSHTWWHREINDPSHIFDLRDAQDYIINKIHKPTYVSLKRNIDLNGLQLAFHHHIKQKSFLKILALLKYHFNAKSGAFQVFPKSMIKHHSLYSSTLKQSDINSLKKLMAAHLPSVYIRNSSKKGGLVYFESREADQKASR